MKQHIPNVADLPLPAAGGSNPAIVEGGGDAPQAGHAGLLDLSGRSQCLRGKGVRIVVWYCPASGGRSGAVRGVTQLFAHALSRLERGAGPLRDQPPLFPASAA